jgi:hypothetical protein
MKEKEDVYPHICKMRKGVHLSPLKKNFCAEREREKERWEREKR